MDKYRLKTGFIFVLWTTFSTPNIACLPSLREEKYIAWHPPPCALQVCFPGLPPCCPLQSAPRAQSFICRKRNAIKWQVQCEGHCDQVKQVPSVWIAPGISYSELRRTTRKGKNTCHGDNLLSWLSSHRPPWYRTASSVVSSANTRYPPEIPAKCSTISECPGWRTE